jgi:2-oxo-4-hydroxy-4-carboxy-5-ureidoimidazoline decarboxylase
MAEVSPIDDIRSTARYRATVAGNLVVEFLNRLKIERTASAGAESTDRLAQWNRLPVDEATAAILPCCGSKTWARRMAARRPLTYELALIAASNEICRDLQAEDWLEAFRSHPRIGESRTSEDPALESKSAQSVTWSTQEQRNVADADAALKKMLAEANREYERRFNRIFIVCASGKSAAEIMEILHRRLNNDAQTELREAAEQQRQITEIRLKKWLQQ